jgi:cellulose synthase/poly-beta-1,6-N-acetylglucosamine synthase-like glycosyltransferase/peptidoglycan/xylan/chitin deacetylase (PgdA/CDA1 family)/spore germination protein YaaH
MKKNQFIFQDQVGKRWPRLKFLFVVGSLFLFAACVVFIHSLLVASQFASPNSLVSLKRQIRAYKKPGKIGSESGFKKEDNTLAMMRLKDKTASGRVRAAKPKAPETIKAAFFPRSDEAAFRSLDQHKGILTHLCPEWLTFTALEVGPVGDEEGDWERIAASGAFKLLPVLSNLDGDKRVPEAVEALALAEPSVRKRFIENLSAKLEGVGASGVVLDWEEVDQGGEHELSALVGQIAEGLKKRGLETWLCVRMDATFAGWDFDFLSPRVARFVAMLHDEHGETDAAGPIVSQDWFDGWLGIIDQLGFPEKWIASLACHGLDWKEDVALAEQISFAEAMSRAGNAGCTEVRNEGPFFNATFSYFFEGATHEVWFLDAASFANQANEARAYGFGGIALNRVGIEDPLVWSVLAATAPVPSEQLGSGIPGGYGITAIGTGEVVNLDPTSFDGQRTFSTEASDTISCIYETLPSHPTLFRMGGDREDFVSLTFDDGPDPEWTPAILDILKAEGLKATFFVVGSEAERYPDLVRRIVAEGHEIGNHSFTHPNLAESPETLVRLELNANQRLIESLVGKSMTLFRPPYNADSRPSRLDELEAIRIAQSLGYMTVLENVDPRDWQAESANDLLERVKTARPSGNIILFHDAGGDRSATVEALPAVIAYLRERGDHIVPVSELLDIPKEKIMPPVDKATFSFNFLTSGLGFEIIRILQSAMRVFLIVASILVVIRTVLVVALARSHKAAPPGPARAVPPLSVIIPAFNEEKVIGKTIRSFLDSHYAGPMEVVVVDDGSTDSTAEVVAALGDPRVRLLRQANSGKAHALQNGVAQARHDILVFVDADTIFAKDALGHLAATFHDERIGAVSGQARVGNLRSFLARCQDLEYVCNFNLDRRAYAAWNCITVVPGAISAIRRAAIQAAGGYSFETLAEDTDLTLAIHKAGYRVAYEPKALAYTEAPETLRQLATQRFRWAFGTLQCVWKHRDLIFNPRFKALGWFSLPSIWFFQVFLVAFSPVIDLLFLQSLFLGRGGDILPYFLGFLLSDIVLAVVAVSMERLPLRIALRIIPQRFIYRPLLSYVVWRSLLHALRGAWVGWGKLPRTASVSMP